MTTHAKVALITGAARGIGLATTEILLERGWQVAMVDRDGPALSEAAAGLQGVNPIVADVSIPAEVEAMRDAALSRFGRLDGLVNNAGVAQGAPIESFPLEDFDRMLDINVKAVFAAIQRAVPHLGTGGRIITIGSVNADRVPTVGFSVYALTKAAVAGLTRGLVRELGPRGITINTIQPGPVATDMNPDTGDFADELRPLIATGQYGQPRDIASAVAYLAHPESGFITGVTWNIDGGFVI